jgi:hypothetical protein
MSRRKGCVGNCRTWRPPQTSARGSHNILSESTCARG